MGPQAAVLAFPSLRFLGATRSSDLPSWGKRVLLPCCEYRVLPPWAAARLCLSDESGAAFCPSYVTGNPSRGLLGPTGTAVCAPEMAHFKTNDCVCLRARECCAALERNGDAVLSRVRKPFRCGTDRASSRAPARRL